MIPAVSKEYNKLNPPPPPPYGNSGTPDVRASKYIFVFICIGVEDRTMQVCLLLQAGTPGDFISLLCLKHSVKWMCSGTCVFTGMRVQTVPHCFGSVSNGYTYL